MAKSNAEMSRDTAQVSECDYQVFLNFRGPDTRHGFTAFLYADLVEAGVRVFRDDDELRVGEVIGDNLLKAINNSTIYISVFSQTYASSKWCLRELAHIIDNVSNWEDKKSIIPIFFHVKPDDVKLKTSLYSNALLEHKEKFPNEVEAWTEALAKVGKIKGWNVEKNQSQPKIVKLVVERVLKELEIKQKSVTEHFIGHDQVQKLRELLHVNCDDVRLIGIYGMGGIGKTTTAKIIFNQLCSHFGKRCCFLEDVRERSSKEGIVQLQKNLLLDIVDARCAEKVKNSEGGRRMIGGTFSTEKVLVVLDDVDKKEHIMKLIGNSKLHAGSRIIITTRDRGVPQVEGFEGDIRLYEMLKMDDGLALKLFCWHAFGTDFPRDVYHELSIKIVSHMGGLPLAVEVVGSLLKGKNEKFWKETLARLKKEPEEEVLNKLRISYDNLDKYQRQIFLDIACCFFNEKKFNASYMWANCSFYPERGLDVLSSRCLIKILDNDKFWMHDQLIALGRQIVREESQDDLRKQSRLWVTEDVLQIIGTKEMKHDIQGLQIDGPIEITCENFERLPKLRFLNLKGGTYAGNFARCRPNLRWLSWRSPPEKDFGADNVYFDRLAVCKLHAIKFKDDSKAWDLFKGARDLKVLSITRCSGITTIPDISKCSGLESLTLAYCSSLKKIESFIGDLQSLIELKIESCYKFTDLPQEVGALVKLEHFSLRGCMRLRELPGPLGDLASLTEGMRPAECNESGKISFGIGGLSSLKSLDLSETMSLCRIPRTINMLHHLQELNLRGTCSIQELPELPTSLINLSVLCQLQSVPNLSNLTNLVGLYLDDDSAYEEKSDPATGCNLWWIGRLSRLKRLKLNLPHVSVPQELASLSDLEFLYFRALDLKSFVRDPSSYWRLGNLSELDIHLCEVEDIPLDGLLLLEKFTLFNNVWLQRLSIPSELTKLREVKVTTCTKLVEIQVMGLSKSLQFLRIAKCHSLTKIGGLSYLKNLETLELFGCAVLTDVEGLNELGSLKYLEVSWCGSVKKLIDLSCTSISDDCQVLIWGCADSVIGFARSPRSSISLKRYKEKILRAVLDQKDYITIRFVVGGKVATDGSGHAGGMEWKIENVIPSSVTYEGLIAEVEDLGIRLERMWYTATYTHHEEQITIESDEQVKGMVQIACTTGFISLCVEGRIESEASDAECSEATGNRKRMRDGSVDGAKTENMKDRKEDRDI